MMKKIPIFVLPIFMFLLISMIIISFAPRRSENSADTFTITTSFYPLYFFAKQIGGDHVFVINLTPSGVEPHDYELSTNDVIQIEKSDLVIINGAGLEPWGDKIGDLLKDPQSHVVVASLGLTLHNDPHVWIDPVLAKEEVKKIASSVYDKNTINMVSYMANAQKLEHDLDQLDSEFREGLSHCKQKTIVTSHDAFGYLAKRYDLSQISVSGLSPDEEPSTKKMSEVSNFIKANNIHYIFFEELVSPKISETLAREAGVQTLVFNPLEGLTKAQEEKGEDYFSIQRENLRNLQIALECN